MATTWRWDQGRLDYFKFDHIKLIAQSLVQLDGIDFIDDPLRTPLTSQTGLPFAPAHYTVWRNYARVFGCSLLASRIGKKLIVTELCGNIAGVHGEPYDVDEYLSFIISRHYYPSPVFSGYNKTSEQIFPFCAVLRYLLSRCIIGENPEIELADVFSILVGNQAKGDEPVEDYLKLKRTGYAPKGDEKRQTREMLIFISQFSMLKWFNNTLFLDIEPGLSDTLRLLEGVATPIKSPREKDRATELIKLGSLTGPLPSIPMAAMSADIIRDQSFIEGKKVRVSHLRTERSPQLRKLYLGSLKKPILCDACKLDAERKYPWTNSIIEVHHLLPLGSCLSVDGRGVSFDDLVPNCSNCHKSIHAYYRIWLKDNEKEDFANKAEAIEAYNKGKELIESYLD